MFVKDLVGNNFTVWKGGESVFIDADTGTGKTSFVLEQLVPAALKEEKEVLFLSNRNLLRSQVKRNVARRQELPVDNADWLEGIEEFEGITLLSYQKLQELVKLGMDSAYYSNRRYQYVIFDEAHYVLEDSLFNPKIVYLLEFIKKIQGIRIFLSATMSDVKQFLIDGEYVGKTIHGMSQKISDCLKMDVLDVVTNHVKSPTDRLKCIWQYTMPRTKRKYDIRYFSSYEEIVEVMNKSREKWIVFISNKAGVRKWESELKISYDIIYAEEKKPELVEAIVANERFDAQALISTKVLDNGVNFHDSELRNIVIDTISQTEFIQMLGRKRLNGEEDAVTLYIPQKSLSFFNGYLNLNAIRIEKLLKGYEEGADLLEKMLEDSSGEVYETVRKFFVWRDGKLQMNPAGMRKISLQVAFLMRMQKEMTQDKFAFIKEQLSWLDRQEDFSEKNFLSHSKQIDKIYKIEKFLEKKSGKWMDKTEQEEFRRKLRELLIDANLYEDKKSRLIGKCKLEILLREKFPRFCLQTKRGAQKGTETHWMIRRTEG